MAMAWLLLFEQCELGSDSERFWGFKIACRNLMSRWRTLGQQLLLSPVKRSVSDTYCKPVLPNHEVLVQLAKLALLANL